MAAGKDIAVLLLSFGGVDSPDAILPFLKNIIKGRAPSQEVVDTMRERYNRIGGKSPITDITRMQAHALQSKLKNITKESLKVYVGMRHWHPFIKDTLLEIEKAGCKKIIAICMTPQRSKFSAGGYKNDLLEGIKGLQKKPEVVFVPEWHLNCCFHEAVAEKINSAMASFKNKGNKTAVIFSAHSLPLKFLDKDDPYVKQIQETIREVLTFTGPLDWRLGYQSRGFIPGDWLEPTVESIIENLPEEGYKNVLIVPIVFVSDHIETLYDIDILYREQAESLDLNFNRSESLNASPKFIDALAEIVIGEISNE
jgi:ferrochelatase